MNQSVPGVWGNLGYTRARRLIIAVGFAALAVIGAITYLRGVDPAEVKATLLFIPIFLAFIFWDIKGGILAGVLAGLVYYLLRYTDIQLVGADRFAGLILYRAGAFLAFGFLGGWASKQLGSSLSKLEIYDLIDDDTGLFNARFFVQDTDLETTRSKRYQTIFSLAVLDIPTEAMDALSRRQRQAALRELGRMLRESIRTIDRAVHAHSSTSHRIAVVLPETGREGAEIFSTRFAARVADYLERRGAPASKDRLKFQALTYPEDGTAIESLQAEFRQIDRAEHPEEPPAPRKDAGGESA